MAETVAATHEARLQKVAEELRETLSRTQAKQQALESGFERLDKQQLQFAERIESHWRKHGFA